MEAYKREFIEFLQEAGVLKFGDFTAKSGRKIPYFVNAGMIKTGDQISKLGEFYAKAYFDKLGKKDAVLYGPAYKGIPLSISAAVALSKNGLDVDMTNLHAAGTCKMMEAAIEGLTRPDGTRPMLIAVTQLTSTDQEAMENDLLIKEPLPEVVMHYALNAKKAGLDGVVCSPLESKKVHDSCGEGFVTVTPGVRFADGDKGDQKRVMTPADAKAIGSDYIVVGRPITAAEDPVAAYERCVAEFVD